VPNKVESLTGALIPETPYLALLVHARLQCHCRQRRRRPVALDVVEEHEVRVGAVPRNLVEAERVQQPVPSLGVGDAR
jgi:hypothetical protein